MIFVTVGTEYPFDRLIRTVDSLFGSGALEGPAFAQIGAGTFRPSNIESVDWLSRTDFEARLASADAVIGHAGMGTILSCVGAGKPLLVLPRRGEFGETVNDHQLWTVERLTNSGLFLVARDEHELAEKAVLLRGFRSDVKKSSRPALVQFIRSQLDD